jgi:hypothetical protein
MYTCYYYGIKERPLQSIIEHCKLLHGEEILKYRQLVLDENTGIQRYQTKMHEGVVPSNLTKYGKCSTVNDGLTYILDKESNKKKLNTPVKENFCKNLFQTPKINQNEGNDFENNEIQMKVCCPSEKEIPQCDSKSIEINDMIDLLLKVLKSLEDVGQKESFLKSMGLLASGTFPLHNICYLLLLDIVEWFSCDSTTHMRYGHETVKFWQIGYWLFHGKFLRFMSGIPNFGQIWDGTSERFFLSIEI